MAFGTAVLLLDLSLSKNSALETLVVGLIAFAVIFSGLYCLVESRITVIRAEQVLRVRRVCLWASWNLVYPLQEIKTVVVLETPKGRGLQLILLSGKKIGLTMSVNFQDLGDVHMILDGAVRRFRARLGSGSPDYVNRSGGKSAKRH